METPAHIAAQRIVGGSLALDLLNTQNGPAGGAPGGRRAPRLRRRGRLGCVRRDARPRRGRAAAPAVTPPSRPPLARSTSACSRRAATCTSVSCDRERPEPPALGHRAAAARRGGGAGARGARPRRRRLRVALGGRRPGATAVAGHPRRAAAPDGRPARSRQGLRDVPVPLPRPEQEPEPAVVLDGGLRHRRQDAQVRRAAGVRPLGELPGPSAAARSRRGSTRPSPSGADRDRVRARRRPVARKTTRRKRAFAASRSTVPRITPSTGTAAWP